MYKVYILKSINFRRYYVGHTADINKRVEDHNAGLTRSTKGYVPWELIYTEDYQTKAEAMRREKQIKSYKGGNAFKKLINKI